MFWRRPYIERVAFNTSAEICTQGDFTDTGTALLGASLRLGHTIVLGSYDGKVLIWKHSGAPVPLVLE